MIVTLFIVKGEKQEIAAQKARFQVQPATVAAIYAALGRQKKGRLLPHGGVLTPRGCLLPFVHIPPGGISHNFNLLVLV